MIPSEVPAWIDVQANPERASSVGNTERVAYGYTEIEVGGTYLNGRDQRIVTPVRLKLALLPNFELGLGTEGAIFTVAGQRAAGVVAGGRTVVYKDPASSFPDLVLRGAFTSPFPTPALEVGRMRSEVVIGKRLSRDFRWDASMGADFSANLGAVPLAGAAVQAWYLYPFGFMAEAKVEGTNLAAGATMLYSMTPREIVDIGAYYHLDGSVDVRFGITRTLPLPWPILLPLEAQPVSLLDCPYPGGQASLPDYPAGPARSLPDLPAGPERALPDYPAGPTRALLDYRAAPPRTLPDYPAGPTRALFDYRAAPPRTLPDYPAGPTRALLDYPAGPDSALLDYPSGPPRAIPDFPGRPRGDTPDFPYSRHDQGMQAPSDGAR